MTLADRPHLCLCFTRNVSLQQWERQGMFDREVALYRRLVERGWRVSFVTYGDRSDLDFADRLPGIDILCNRWNLRRSVYAAMLPWLHARSLRGCDVVKTNQTYGGDVALRLAKRLGVPLIARCGYMLSDFAKRQHGEDSVEATRFQRLEARLWKAAARIVVTTQDMADEVTRRCPESVDRTMVIPNYVDTAAFSPAAVEAADASKVDLVYVGRIHPQKNLPVLLDAVERLPGVTLRLIGAGDASEMLKDSVELAKRVLVHGPADHADLPGLLRRAKVFVLPSLYEGHPKTLIEAMACGMPIVASDVPGIAGVVEHEKTGLLASTDASSLASAIERLLRDTQLREQLGDEARREAETKYSLDRIVCDEAAQLERAIASCSPPPGNSEMQPLSRLTASLAVRLARCVATPRLQICVMTIIRDRLASLSAEEAARFALTLDAQLYAIHGRLAVAYGQGLHTKHRHTGYHRFFTERLGPGDKVLDIGCGFGALAHSIAEHTGAKVTGIDINPEAIRIACERFPHPNCTYHNGDVLRELPGGKYDVIVMSNVLEHLRDRSDFLAKAIANCEAKRALIRVPVFERDWRVPLKKELGVEWRLDPTHETEFTMEQFREETERGGLCIDHVEVRWGEIWAELSVAESVKLAA